MEEQKRINENKESVQIKPEDIQKAKKKGGIFGDPIIEI